MGFWAMESCCVESWLIFIIGTALGKLLKSTKIHYFHMYRADCTEDQMRSGLQMA